MAFNPRIPNASSPSRAVDPGPLGPSIFGAAADTVSTVLSTADSALGRSSGSGSAVENPVLDQVALLEFERQHGEATSNRSDRVNAILSEDQQILPSTVLRQLRALEGNQEAFDQGLLGIDAHQLNFETGIMELVQNHPDQAAEIMTWMDQRGLDSQLFRDVAQFQETQESQREAQATREEGLITWGVQNIPGFDQLDRPTQIHLSAQRQAIQAEADRLHAVWQQDTERTDEERTALNRETVSVANQAFLSDVAPIVNTVFDTIAQSGNDLEAMNSMRSQLPGLVGHINSVAQAQLDALPPEAGADARNGILEIRDEYIESLTTVLGDPDVNSVMTNIQQSLVGAERLRLSQAIPSVNSLEALVGSDFVGPVLETYLNQSLISSGLQRELTAFLESGTSTPAGRRGVGTVQALGTPPDQVTPEVREAFGGYYRDVLPQLADRALNSENYLTVDDVETPLEGFASFYEGAMNVARQEVIPGQVQGAQLLSISDNLYGADITGQMIALAEENEIFTPVLERARREAARWLDIGQEVAFDPFADWAIRFDENTGRYETFRKAVTHGIPIGTGLDPSQRAELRRRGVDLNQRVSLSGGVMPEGMMDTVDGMNRMLDFLVETHQYSIGLDPSASGRDIRVAFATDNFQLIQQDEERTPPSESGTGPSPELAGAPVDQRQGAITFSETPESDVRGIRNNNPGNIEQGADWMGLSADQSSDERFAVFETPEHGIRAMTRIIRNYNRLYNINTLREVVSRWAPAVENDVEAYVENVSEFSGLDPDTDLDFTDNTTMAALIQAMIRQENGVQPYEDTTIDHGVELGLR